MGPYRSIAFGLAVLGVCVGAPSASHRQQDVNSILNQTPYTYLLDTGVPSTVALSEKELAQKKGWTIVPEDNLRHNFKGDTIFLNDKITVVLRQRGPGAEVYAKTPDGLKQRALLVAYAGRADGTAGISSVRIIENNPGAVILEAVFQTEKGKSAAVTYRLTTGQIYVEISPGEGISKFLIQVDTRHVVVPDFFGDDVVFSAGAFEDSGHGLPAENFFLSMVEGNDAIVMCVWESDKQATEVILSGEGRDRVIHGYEIQCTEDKRIWVAFMESCNIWHGCAILDKDKGKDIILDWEPPFSAKWRADFIKEDELVESCNFSDQQEQEFGSRVPGEVGCSCWCDGSRFYIRVPKLQTTEKSESAAAKYPGSVIVYPIDRSRVTPLMVFCPVDILRNTLGVGPCEYILEKEGFDSGSYPTPDQVTRWVEKQFKKNKEEHASAEIKERLKEMVDHIRHAQIRTNQYGDFARQVQELSEKEKSNKVVVDALGKLLAIVNDMEQNTVIKSNSAKSSESAAILAGKIVALIGKDNALVESQEPAAQIRAIGAAQDKALSKCRMAVRRIKQQCLMITSREPQAADFARKVQQLAEEMLQRK